MADTKKNTIGFFNKEKKHSPDMAYKEDIPVKETYKGSGLKAFDPSAEKRQPQSRIKSKMRAEPFEFQDNNTMNCWHFSNCRQISMYMN